MFKMKFIRFSKKNGLNKSLITQSVALAIVSFTGLAQAQANSSQSGVNLSVGGWKDTVRLGLTYEAQPLFSQRLGDNGARLEFNGELGAAVWFVSPAVEAGQGMAEGFIDGIFGQKPSAKGSRTVGQFSLIPMLRLYPTERFYLEAGIGPSFFTHTQVSDKNLGTKLQFASQLGLGYQLAQNHRLGLRYSYISNFGLKQRGSALSAAQINYTYQF
jgi:lipid A 3-O-deacylase